MRLSQKQERAVAKRYSGSVNAGSGNGWVRKSDVRSNHVLFEMKYTDAKSFSLKAADLEKAEKYALIDGREMVFGVSFSGIEYMLVPEEYYHRLHDALHTPEDNDD